ncbi:TetR family transcriptional regulator [Leifsonia poae]|uniref:TetR/AcrR family transcriptional regulator n=1 Tax=Leifsonia poae TaxID=110933 RepID=UPI003D66CE45
MATGDLSNRDRILRAARDEFATHGFRGATMRSIAAAAGFDVALLAHYFGNKDGLFAATLQMPDGVLTSLRGAFDGPQTTRGERLTRLYLTTWEEGPTGKQMQLLARSALSNDAAAAAIRQMFGGGLAEERAIAIAEGRQYGTTLAMTHLFGVAFGRYVLRVPQLTELDLDALVARTAPSVQLLLDTPDSTSVAGE